MHIDVQGQHDSDFAERVFVYNYRIYGRYRRPVASLVDVFGLVTAAHLLTQQTRGQHVQRHAAKWKLARLLYQRDWDKQAIIDLFAVIDWMMQLPRRLQDQLLDDIAALEKERSMPYMNPFEKRGIERGLRNLLEIQLEQRFGKLPQAVRDRLLEAEADDLQAWGIALIDAPSLDRVFSPR